MIQIKEIGANTLESIDQDELVLKGGQSFFGDSSTSFNTQGNLGTGISTNSINWVNSQGYGVGASYTNNPFGGNTSSFSTQFPIGNSLAGSASYTTNGNFSAGVQWNSGTGGSNSFQQPSPFGR